VAWGWQAAFLFTGVLSATWLATWLLTYRTPERQPKLSSAELAYIQSDPAEPTTRVPWATIIRHRQAWAFIVGKFMTDPIWWFLLFWLPKFLAESHGIRGVDVVPYLTGVYVCADVGSLTSGYVSSALVKRGWSLNAARKITMLVLTAIASPMIITAGFMRDPVIAIVLIAIACGVHQAWSAMVWTLPTDLFPSRATASVAGIGAAVASVVAIVTAEVTGQYLNANPAAYGPIFVVAGLLYPLALAAVHICSPRLEQAKLP
jgi:ACS family hexuronate transporter-like MFS transporter